MCELHSGGYHGPNANPALKVLRSESVPRAVKRRVHCAWHLQKLYASLLRKTTNGWSQTDPVSGIELGVPWCLIQPCKPGGPQCTPCNSGSSQCNLAKGEDWQWISDVFEAIGSKATLISEDGPVKHRPRF